MRRDTLILQMVELFEEFKVLRQWWKAERSSAFVNIGLILNGIKDKSSADEFGLAAVELGLTFADKDPVGQERQVLTGDLTAFEGSCEQR